MKWLGITLVAISSVACAAEPGPGPYSGYYISSFERSLFKPVGSHERWWLSGNYSCPNTRMDLKPADDSATPPVFLVVKGQLSAKGKHGHMGAYDRMLEVSETVSCRPVDKDEKVEF